MSASMWLTLACMSQWELAGCLSFVLAWILCFENGLSLLFQTTQELALRKTKLS